MTKYDEKSITVLEGLDAVKKRPGMYIGSTDKKGMHHLAWEIIDNSIDEIINGFGDKVTVTINEDNSLTVTDNGRGIPVGKHETGKSTPEVIYTVLHAGGKFEDSGYKIAGGLHGVGASVVNALSEFLEVTINRDGFSYKIGFSDGGKLDFPLEKIGPTNKTGTSVTFLPSKEIFKNINFSFTTLCERMQESAFLLNNLTVEVEDVLDEKKNIYHYENGIISFVEYINEGKKSIHEVIPITGSKNNIDVDIAIQYVDTYNENILSFVNNVKTIDGGTHEVGFKTAITKAFNDYAKDKGLLKEKDSNFEGSDAREGLTAVLNIKIPENLLQFEGQTKGKLGTPAARSIVESITYDTLRYYLEENREISEALVDKMNRSKIARDAARKARADARAGRSKKGAAQSLSGKLTPAQTRNPKINELYIVEGNSAGGTAKKARDRKFQAILPLRGKILNTEKAKTEDIFKNEEINSMIHAIGAGVGAEFDVGDINYDKVIIMTDADDDGAHIQCLLLTFFYRFMKPLIDEGHLYIAMPPLYKVDYGKNHEYCWTDEELKEITANKVNYKVQRYKGLGEMNPTPLWETTMDPKTRNLIKVNINDASLAEKRVSVLMGDVVESRKEWINENVEFSLEDDYAI
ncbi:MAG TPA: DNA topoisomerase IV subunit B [Mollicutes bacterium]|jgi:topoisomerase-4 subunit B|nr:DNA topoisomerase IV subunit B [Mollicutes bacterium]